MNTLCLSKAVSTASQALLRAIWHKLARVASVCACLLVAFASMAVPARAAVLLSPPQLEQLVAPVALYPDSLLSQVLMASTYPLEVVEAARWRASQPRVMSDSQLSAALYNEPWDPSVKSLAAFPDVLRMMSDKIDWTEQLGDAFLGQQPEVMDAVQRLRARARAAGNLRTTPQQTVLVSDDSTPIIQIVPVQPDIVYVPIYNPLVVYGPWMYPAYRPFYWYPPAYSPPPGVFFSFGVGLVVGPALWGHVDWHRRDVNINVVRYNRFNNTHITNNRWIHNADHRRGVDYRGPARPERFQRGDQSGARSAAREQYRNTANTQRQQLNDPARRQEAERAVSRGQTQTGPQRGAPNSGPVRGDMRRDNAAGRPNAVAPQQAAPRSLNTAPRESQQQRAVPHAGPQERAVMPRPQAPQQRDPMPRQQAPQQRVVPREQAPRRPAAERPQVQQQRAVPHAGPQERAAMPRPQAPQQREAGPRRSGGDRPSGGDKGNRRGESGK
jgi:hypothetical protein